MRTSLLAVFIATASCGQATSSSPAAPGEAASGAAAVDAASDVVVTWEGGRLSRADLQEYLGVKLVRLEADYLSQRYEAERGGLDELLAEKLLEAEAARTGAGTVEALLEAEVTNKVPVPTEAEIQQFYNMMKRRLRGQPLEQVRPQVAAEIQRRGQAERFEAYLGQVRDRYKVSVALQSPDLPRIPVSVDDDPSKGPEDAPVTIVQFAEFQCPYCGRAKETIDQLLEKYPEQIRMVFRDFPLGFHDRAIPAAVAANCAGAQGKYWEMFDLLMTHQKELSDADLLRHATTIELDIAAWTTCRADPSQEAEVKKDMEDGAEVGVTGTPAFFVNGIMLSGAQPYSAFEEIIERELAARG